MRRRGVRPVEVAAVLGGAGALAGSWVVAAAEDRVPGWEVATFEAVNGLPDALRPAAWVPMQAGSFAGSIAVAGTAAAITRDRRLGLAALVASQVGFWSAKGIKKLVGRGRPVTFVDAVRVRERADDRGYISGHAAVAFALATALAPSLPRGWRVAVLTTASTVAASRLYVGVHLPLDVVGGAGFGVLLGTLARWSFGLGGEGLPVRA